MIKIEHLVKNYGSNCAVDDISVEVGEGEIVGFLGPNGAGKSTTMNILTGYLSSTSGKATIAGIDILSNPIGAKKLIGYLPEQPPLYLDMTVEEYLKFKHLHKKKYRPRFDGAEDRCAFCWAKFGESEGELHEGYCSADEAHWICGLCFDCYKDKFGWQVEDETGRSFASAEELVDLVSRGGEIELRYHGILYNVIPMFTRETVTSAKVGVGCPFGPERLAAAELDGKTVAELIESGSMVFQLNREAPPQRVTSVEQLLFVLGADGFATADHGEDGYTLLVRVDDYEGMITIVGMIWKDVMLSDIPDFKVNGSRIRDIIADSEVLFRPEK